MLANTYSVPPFTSFRDGITPAPCVYVCVCVLLLLRIRCLWLLHIVHPSPVAFFRGRCVCIVKAMAADEGPHRRNRDPFERDYIAVDY